MWRSACRAWPSAQRAALPVQARVFGRRTLTAAASSSGAPSNSNARKLRLSHILVPADKEAVLDQLQAQLQAGSDFAELAKQHSTCPSGKKGGDLGWIARGATVPPFEAAAFGAAVGDTVRASTDFGHHLIRVMEERVEAEVQRMFASELKELLSVPELLEDVQLVDVREQGEYDLAHLPAFKLLPLSQAQEWSQNIEAYLEPSKRTVVLCHHGMRSMQMCSFLVGAGFADVTNVNGGIHAYSEIDPSVPKY